MIVKILSAGKTFSGVEYNDKKVANNKGELMSMKKFPSFIDENSGKEVVKNYFKSVSKSEKVKKPQFHAVISTKFQEHTKEELKIIAEAFMEEMGYGNQPYITVFHNDTDNNHIHIVSTRVDKRTGKKINDSFEKLKSQRALQNVLERIYPENKIDEDLNKLLSFKYGSLNQLKTLLERNGYKGDNLNDKEFGVFKNGVLVKKINGNHLKFDKSEDKNRKNQIRAILKKYSAIYSNKAFRVVDDRKEKDLYEKEGNAIPKIEWESELQKKMRDMFGIDIIFHHKDGQKPFGFTLIDNKSKMILKGSEIIKMNEIFEFTNNQIDKRNFEILKDFNVSSEKEKEILKNWYNRRHPHAPIHIHMLFYNKNKNFEIKKQGREDVLKLIESGKKESDKVNIIKDNGKFYAIHSQLHQIWKLDKILNAKEYQSFIEGPKNNDIAESILNIGNDLTETISDVVDELIRPNYGAEIEDDFDPRKKKRKKR